MSIRVLLAEDEPNAFQRCADVIDLHPRLSLAGEAHCLADAMALLGNDTLAYDFLLTDLRLGDGHGAELIRAWRARGGKFAMVVSVFGDVESVMAAVEAGADGYLLKSGSDDEMLTALTTVLDGGAPISASVAGHLLRKLRKDDLHGESAEETKAAILSERETDILTDLAKGLSYKEVARSRSISPHTVGDHVKAIYRKLAVTSRGEAVFQALHRGLINLPKS
ncbi:MAG: response regulator transcription factor [Pseudomonadota bacterium]